MNELVITRQYLDERKDVIRQAVAKDATAAQLEMFLHVAATYGLDPFRKEIYFSPRVGCVVGRDGLLKLAQRNERFKMLSSAVYEGDKLEVTITEGGVAVIHQPTLAGRKGFPIGAWAVVTVGESQTWAWAPYKDYAKATDVWKTYPDAMIVKCAESLALRKASNITGVVSEDEIGGKQSKGETIVDVEPTTTDEPEEDADSRVGSETPEPIVKKDAPTPAPNGENPGDAHRKRAFALSAKLVGAMTPLGITEDDLWAYVTHKYGVASRKDITPAQWKETADAFAALETNTAKQVALAERIKSNGDSAWLTQEQATAYIAGDVSASATALVAHADRYIEKAGWKITLNRRLGALEFNAPVGALLNSLRENPTADDVLILASSMVDEGAWQQSRKDG